MDTCYLPILKSENSIYSISQSDIEESNNGVKYYLTANESKNVSDYYYYDLDEKEFIETSSNDENL